MWKNHTTPDGTHYPLLVQVYSWDTMTECVKYVIEFKYDPRDGWGHIEIGSKYVEK